MVVIVHVAQWCEALGQDHVFDGGGGEMEAALAVCDPDAQAGTSHALEEHRRRVIRHLFTLHTLHIFHGIRVGDANLDCVHCTMH